MKASEKMEHAGDFLAFEVMLLPSNLTEKSKSPWVRVFGHIAGIPWFCLLAPFLALPMFLMGVVLVPLMEAWEGAEPGAGTEGK